jgi:hypothetical protein
MGPRLPKLAVFAIGPLLLVLSGCSSTTVLQSIVITPATGTQVLTASGQTVQYTAIGTYVQGQRPATKQDITKLVTWVSGNTAVATVSSAGVVTAVTGGTASISATSELMTSSSDVTVNLSSAAPAVRALVSILVLPGSQGTGVVGETAQFIAIGTYNTTPLTADITNLVKWSSSDTNVAKVNATGLTTAINPGSTTILATATSASGAVTIATAAFLSSAGTVGATLPTVAVYRVGANAAAGSVTGSYVVPGTTTVQTPLNCSAATPAGCSVFFPVGVIVTFTTQNQASFGGWSSDCTPVMATATAAADPYSCTVMLSPSATGQVANVSVGAIFN